MPMVVRIVGTNAAEAAELLEAARFVTAAASTRRRPRPSRAREGSGGMSILIGRDTRLVVQGITGREGEFHSRAMLEYGTQLVAGMTPGKGGQTALDGRVPVFNTVADAVRETGANTSCIFVPAAGAPDAVLEAVAAGIKTIFCITEGIPALDMIPVVEEVRLAGARLIGPNCPGATSPGRAKVGIIPGSIHREGRVGVVSRSGTLTYEAVQAMTDAGLGQSTCVGIGGDPIIGTPFLDVLKLFAADPETEALVLIGEIGGAAEEEAAAWAAEHLRDVPKARSSPAGRRPRASGWATPARSSRAARGRRRPRSRRSRRPGSGSPARRPSCRRSCAPPATGADGRGRRTADLATSGTCSPTTAGRHAASSPSIDGRAHEHVWGAPGWSASAASARSSSTSSARTSAGGSGSAAERRRRRARARAAALARALAGGVGGASGTPWRLAGDARRRLARPSTATACRSGRCSPTS